MAKKETGFDLSSFITWMTSVLVSLAVGSGMISKVLTVPYIYEPITQAAGWIVVVGAIISVILAIFKR